jgi:hypothetical protein
MRLLLLRPAGSVYDRSLVRMYGKQELEGVLKATTNTGDLFVHEATLQLLDAEQVETVHNPRAATEADIARWNAECDAVVIRGSNYLHAKADFSDILPLLEKLKLPVVAFAFGAQARDYGEVGLHEGAVRALRLISERSASIGVRGAFTQEVLARHGFTNTRAIGCPSIFRHNRPQVEMRFRDPAMARNLALTAHFSLAGDYAHSTGQMNRVQARIARQIAARFRLTLLWQGDRVGKVLYYGVEAEMAETADRLAKMKWLDGPEDPFLPVLRRASWFGTSARDYYEMAATQDFVVGVRLHGNVTALASGVPALYVVYDSRTREFADLFGIPTLDAYREEEFSFEAAYDPARYTTFTRRYAELYQEMRCFLDENGLANRMQPPPGIARDVMRLREQAPAVVS